MVEIKNARLCGELGSQVGVEIVVKFRTLLKLQDIGHMIRPSDGLKNVLIEA